LIKAALVLSAILSLALAEPRAQITDIKLKTVPDLSEARPSFEPVKIILNLLDSGGNPVSAGRLRIRLSAPTPSGLFSTDFPRVEGTLLLEMTLPVVQGRVEWDYVFPIRGIYRLEAESAEEKASGLKKVFELTVKEQRYKFLFLATFLAVLFLFGFIAGRLFTGTRHRSEDRR
jgi:hypothetical protein